MCEYKETCMIIAFVVTLPLQPIWFTLIVPIGIPIFGIIVIIAGFLCGFGGTIYSACIGGFRKAIPNAFAYMFYAIYYVDDYSNDLIFGEERNLQLLKFMDCPVEEYVKTGPPIPATSTKPAHAPEDFTV